MDIQRVIGKLEESSRYTEMRLNQIESKIDSLLAFKWKALGILTLASFLVTLVVDFFRR